MPRAIGCEVSPWEVNPANDFTYDLAALKANQGKLGEMVTPIKTAIALSDTRLARDPKARDLRKQAQNDARFAPARALPEFQEAIKPR